MVQAVAGAQGPRAMCAGGGARPQHQRGPGTEPNTGGVGRRWGPAGVEVFVHAAVAPESHWESAVQDIHWRAETQTAVLEEMLHRAELSSYREWGINE